MLNYLRNRCSFSWNSYLEILLFGHWLFVSNYLIYICIFSFALVFFYIIFPIYFFILIFPFLYKFKKMSIFDNGYIVFHFSFYFCVGSKDCEGDNRSWLGRTKRDIIWEEPSSTSVTHTHKNPFWLQLKNNIKYLQF